MGSLVDDNHRAPNSRTKLIKISGKTNFCLFATKDIQPGMEITASYGNHLLLWWQGFAMVEGGRLTIVY